MINNLKIKSKRGQLTIFIIVAIVIVASIAGYFLLKDRISMGMPKEVEPVYEYFLSCIEDETEMAVLIMGSQGGYLELPEFEAGSEYYPFSSQLDFLGGGVPYWYYVSGNSIKKEQIPSKEKMEAQLEEHLEDMAERCDFSDFEARGFVVEYGEPDVNVAIKDAEIVVGVEMPLEVSFDSVAGRKIKHSVSVDSRLGGFYDTARKIYDREEDSLFLENYAVDILRLYAPVDGTEFSCSPKVWLQEDIEQDLKNALEANVQAIKVKGDYYSLSAEDRKYFIQDIDENVGSDKNVNFLYFKEWPTKVEIYPDEETLVAEPVGLQEGLGMLGFCYVPYHFVYDIAFPVLIQIYDAEEMFQFPIGVVIDKNKPRDALNVEGLPDVVPELCEHKLTEMTVYTYNSQLEPVEADIKFKCFDTNCYIGRTEISGEDAVLAGNFPQCINGFVIANAEGYKTKKYIASSVRESEVSIILDKKYKLDLEIQKNRGELREGYAVVTFVKADETITAVYPEQEEVELTEGQYEIKVYIYTNSTISLEGSSAEKCVDVPKSGVLGIFGLTEEKCFTLDIPDQVVGAGVSGGGAQNWYITESELEEAGKIIISAEDFGVPKKVEDLQINYNNIDLNGLEVEFE